MDVKYHYYENSDNVAGLEDTNKRMIVHIGIIWILYSGHKHWNMDYLSSIGAV